MTLEEAKILAMQQPTPHIVFRFPAWREGVYAVIAERPLPPEAEIALVTKTLKQGSLFG